MPIKPSELILNPDGSVYHLNLRPEHLANTVITVGDPDRVEQVTKHFDSIEFTIHKREFKTQTGTYKGKRITVISTGIGTDNIDIVLNELDALVNIDLKTREVKSSLTSLDIIRVGTSGSLQNDLPMDVFLISTHAVDTTGLLLDYQIETVEYSDLSTAFQKHTHWHQDKARPVVVSGSEQLISKFTSEGIHHGITITASGFYAPQGRSLRLTLKNADFHPKITSFSHNNKRITNLEMETAGIYGLAKLLGHNAISLNAILANRALGTFSKTPEKTTLRLIEYALNKIIT